MKYVDEIGEEPISYVKKYFEKITIERNKEVESAVLMEIQKIAIENGFETKFILNEKNILNALEKQIPKKPKILNYQPLIKAGWKHECPNCGCAVGKNKFTDYEYLEEYEEYCTQCGQALDWSEDDG